MFDYNDPDCADKIRKYANDDLRLCWDTISLEGSAKICCDALASGGKYGTILPVKPPREDVKMTHTLAYTTMGEAFSKRSDVPAKPDHYLFARKWADIADEILMQGLIKVHPSKVMEGGLDGILEGLDLMRNDKVSGQKLVYRVS